MRALQLHVLLALVAVLAAVGARRRAGRAPVASGEPLVGCAVRAVELSGDPSVRLEARADDGVVVAVRGRPTFVGGRAAEALLEELSALRAIRTFEGQREAYGFGEARLRVECAEARHEWRVGGSPPGSADRYLGDDGAVHLIDGGILRALEEADVRLMRRALHDFDEARVARVRVALPDRSLEVAQRFADDPRRRRYVDPRRPDERAPALDRLMGAHRNLRAEAGAEPLDGEPLAAMTFVDAEGAPLGSLDLYRVGEGPGAVFVVRTDALGWVRVPRSTGAAFARALGRLR